MKSEEKEEQLLKSAALQTANAVLVARRRAEQDLVEMKEAFEKKSTELTHSLTMLNATLESTADAILVTDENGQVITWNQKFLEIWPIASELIASREHRKLQKSAGKKFANPKAFRERIAEIYKTEPEETFDVLETSDGKVFERYSKIQCVEERNVGRVWSYRDITDRKKAQKAEAHLAAIVQSSDDAIISKDLNSIITSWNRGAERLFGYTAQEAIGQSITMLMPPERFDEEVGILERIGRGESMNHYETVRRRKDGTLLQISLTVSPITDRNGRIIGASKIARDISERKQAEADLAEREAQLAVFVEHAPAAIAMFDREMRYIAVSRRFVVDYGLPPDTRLIGRSHYEVFPDIPQRWRDIHARVLTGEEASQEEDQFTHQGRTDWVRWSMVPWRRADGNIGGALLFAELRTEQVEARRALTDSEARFRATFENAAVGVALVGSDGSILRGNNCLARMLGYSVEELKTQTFQDLTHPDDLATNLSVFNKTLVGEAESYCIEKRYVRKDGGTVWASLSVGSVRKTDGGVDYFVSVVEDITDRKRAEARLAERNAQLDLAGNIARIGSFMYDDSSKKLPVARLCGHLWAARGHARDFTRRLACAGASRRSRAVGRRRSPRLH